MHIKHLFLGLLASLMASIVYAQSFTYQGYLREGGLPANGSYSMTFRLFSTPSGGATLASVGPISVNVSNGLFAQELNLGNVWNGSDRYLEIQVGSTTLSPRVKINHAPYAIYSVNTRGLNVDSNMNVGLTNLRRIIGLNPSDAFPYDGKTMGHYTLGWFDDSWNGGGATAWLSGFAGIKLFTYATPRMVINATGKVGIGTTNPSKPLQVETNVDDLAIYGRHRGTTGATYGVYGQSDSPDGAGVYGYGFTSTGVYGQTESVSGSGVYGIATATSGLNKGVYGQSNSISGAGVFGLSTSATGLNYGVYGQTHSTQGYGIAGRATAGSGSPIGVYGESMSPTGRGVHGNASSSSGTAWGVFGSTNSSDSFAFGVIGFEPSSSPGHAIYALGTLAATGTKSFQIDHPLRPGTHLLNHFCTEGPEPYNLYRGNVVTDEKGYATVSLPPYFESINRDPTYHLTVIGTFAQAIIAQEVKNNRFVIRTSQPNVKVSWEVKAVRNDLWVQRYGFQTEQAKPDEHQGKYLHPELFAQPEERGILYRPEPEQPAEREKPR